MSSSKWRLETPVASYLCSAHYLITRPLWPLSLSLSLSLSPHQPHSPRPAAAAHTAWRQLWLMCGHKECGQTYKLRTQRDFQLNKSGSPSHETLVGTGGMFVFIWKMIKSKARALFISDEAIFANSSIPSHCI